MPADDVELMQRTCELRTIRTYQLPEVSSDSIKVVTVYIGIDPGLDHYVMNVSGKHEHLCILH